MWHTASLQAPEVTADSKVKDMGLVGCGWKELTLAEYVIHMTAHKEYGLAQSSKRAEQRRLALHDHSDRRAD